jgi:hypothetical protein
MEAGKVMIPYGAGSQPFPGRPRTAFTLAYRHVGGEVMCEGSIRIFHGNLLKMTLNYQYKNVHNNFL